MTLLFWTLVLSSPRRQTALASQSIRTGRGGGGGAMSRVQAMSRPNRPESPPVYMMSLSLSTVDNVQYLPCMDVLVVGGGESVQKCQCCW